MKTFKKIIYISILVLAAYKSQAQGNKNEQVNITNFTANEKDNKVFVNWSTDGTVPTNYFEVQCSNDGKVFNTLALVLGPDPRQTGDSYQFMEKIKGNTKRVFFRLRHINIRGEEQVSKIIQL